MLYDRVKFSKRTWMTRNRVYSKSVNDQIYITVPVNSAPLIKDVILDAINFDAWRNRFIRQLQHNYGQAEYFESVYPMIEMAVVLPPSGSLQDFNYNIIAMLCHVLEIECNLKTTHAQADLIEERIIPFAEEHDVDYKTARVILLCREYDVETYINLPGGRELYDGKTFQRFGIDLLFLEPQEIRYEQFTQEYYPSLSIIDVLMHNGIAHTASQMNNYNLKSAK